MCTSKSFATVHFASSPNNITGGKVGMFLVSCETPTSRGFCLVRVD
jgi:hypothetical protein